MREINFRDNDTLLLYYLFNLTNVSYLFKCIYMRVKRPFLMSVIKTSFFVLSACLTVDFYFQPQLNTHPVC